MRLLVALLAAVTIAATPVKPVLVDQTGRQFTLDSLHGAPVVVTFVSAHCTDACPLVNAQFADAARKIEKRNLHAKLVTITLDPQHDSPSLMRALAAKFDANPQYWLVAGGKPHDVDTVLHWFGVEAKPGRSGYREQHTTFVYVFNRNGDLDETMLASTNLNADVVNAVAKLQ